ncbi:MAG: hypothetical protein ICV73_11755, partial [Acetobacteraceae bacterium]|nr:hypothetical protein [Acetobacteraceae bacterium]
MSASAYTPDNPWSSYYGGAAQMAPQGLFGSVLGALAGPVGGMVAGPAGGVVGGVLGRQLGRVIPFGADPSQQFAPQGAVGDMIGAVGPTLAQHLGGIFNRPQLGEQIGNVLSAVAPMVPFSTAPQAAGAGAEFDPQGFNFGKLLQGAQQAMQAAQQAAHVVNAARQFLPIAEAQDHGRSAGAGAEFDPQGFNFGRLL